MIGGTAGTAIGSAIGSVLLPGIGTWVGGAVGGWAGSAAGGWIGDKAKDIGNFMSSATEGVGDALSGAADYVSEKTKKSRMAYPASLDLVPKRRKDGLGSNGGCTVSSCNRPADGTCLYATDTDHDRPNGLYEQQSRSAYICWIHGNKHDAEPSDGAW